MDKTIEKRKKVIYDLICDDLYVPMKFKELAMLLQVPKDQRNELREILEALEAEGKIYLSQKGKYLKGEAKRIQGVYRASLKGFGFVTVPGEASDIFVAEEDAGGAFEGDQVELVITKEPQGRSREGKIVRILSRGITQLVGL